MGVISIVKVITRAERKGCLTLTQPGNREWVTAIETIRADGTIIPPIIIFAGKVHTAPGQNSPTPRTKYLQLL
jgi:hypothetical protein